jgi:hypothetical protein
MGMQGILVLRDVLGRVVLLRRLGQGATQLVLLLNDLETGTYLYGMERCPARVLVAAR